MKNPSLRRPGTSIRIFCLGRHYHIQQVGFSLVLIILLSGGCCPKIDHFLAYEPVPVHISPENISFTDQFYKENQIGASVQRVAAFANPVEKVHNDTLYKIRNRDHHLTAYYLESEVPAMDRTVLISNQFTNKKDQKIVVDTRPIWILVPTQKLYPNQHRPPRKLSHFVCYSIRQSGGGSTEPVRLRDEFGPHSPVSVGRPMYLCNPATKFHNHRKFRPYNKRDHLVWYQVEEEFQQQVKLENQMDSLKLDLRKISWLGVPSTKKELDPTTPQENP
ncbi:MAG: hypothetical protein R2824_24210 [Saprospiraceae bacterium]|nr:hypothetical protein [Lewinella sp.]